MKKTFFDYYREYAEKTPDKVLLRIDDDTLTYGEFMKKTAVIASGMQKLGISANDKVGIVMPNSIDWYLVFWSAVRIGAQPAPIDPQSGTMELSQLLPSTDVKVCFAAEKYRSNNIISAMQQVVPEKISLDKVVCFTENSQNLAEPFISAEDFFADYCGDSCEEYIPEVDHVMSLACTSGSTGNPKILSVPYYGW